MYSKSKCTARYISLSATRLMIKWREKKSEDMFSLSKYEEYFFFQHLVET